MKLLVIIVYSNFDIEYLDNIIILNNYMKLLNIHVDYCGISNEDDFKNYESVIQFKYKMINSKRQLSKICDFITDYKSELDYDWYMKIRPDIRLLENIKFDILSMSAVNARTRLYFGPRVIKYGLSVGGKGTWEDKKDYVYNPQEIHVILDDMLFLFHNNVIQMGGFEKIYPDTSGNEHEWTQTELYNKRNIPLNVIGINLENTKYKACSGHLNMI